MAEWLRRWTRNPMGSARAGSNPAQCVIFLFSFSFQLRARVLYIRHRFNTNKAIFFFFSNFRITMTLLSTIFYLNHIFKLDKIYTSSILVPTSVGTYTVRTTNKHKHYFNTCYTAKTFIH